jgi:competence protein ComEC
MKFLITLLSLAVVVVWMAALYPKTTKLSLRMLDVGQGDALLLTLPERQTILIDGGPDHTVIERLGTYLPFWEHSLDALILTHPHEDHLVGALDVLNTYTLGTVLSNPVKDEKTASWKAWNAKLTNQRNIRAKDVATIRTEDSQVVLEIFTGEQVSANQNNNSVVVGITYGSVKFALMGDAESELEEELVRETTFFSAPVTVLKVGHHGSQTSSSPPFLETLHPLIGLISCGIDNKFNHPSVNIINRFLYNRTHLFRTDRQGTIEVRTDGNNLEIIPEKEIPILQ